jgi:hypothetical protein
MGELIRFPVERTRSDGALALDSTGEPVQPSTVENDQAWWWKLGVVPAPRAKRHRVIRITQQRGRAMATTACRRVLPVGPSPRDPYSGGKCLSCRKQGWS